MSKSRFVVGIVCTGNTCRSPITAGWLQHFLDRAPVGREVTVWTAGLSLGRSVKVTAESMRIAIEQGLSAPQIAGLKRHRARPLATERRRTDLLVWLTDPKQLQELDDGPQTRAERMRKKAKAAGATLLLIPESDEPWYAKSKGRPPAEIARLYRKQARSLSSWAKVVHSLIA